MKKPLLFFIFLIFSTFSFAQKGNDYILAENYYRNDEYQKASKFYKKLVDKSPYNRTYISKLIKCYQELNQFDVAENFLSEKLKKKPSQTYLNVLLGYNFERQEKNELAIKYYEKSISSI